MLLLRPADSEAGAGNYLAICALTSPAGDSYVCRVWEPLVSTSWLRRFLASSQTIWILTLVLPLLAI